MDETKPWKHQAARTGAALAKPTSAGQEDPSVWVGLALKHLTKRRCWFDQTAMLISPTKQWNHATNIWISSAKMGKQNNMSSSEDNVRFVQQEYRCFQKHLRYMEILTNRKNVFFCQLEWGFDFISDLIFPEKKRTIFVDNFVAKVKLGGPTIQTISSTEPCPLDGFWLMLIEL